MDTLVKRNKNGLYKFFTAIALVLTCVIVVTYSGSVSVNPNPSTPETITFLVGESTIVRTSWPTVRVAVTDPTVAHVNVLTPQQVLLQGLKVGSTDLIVWSEDESQVRQWKVKIRLDTASISAKLNDMFPDTSLTVSQSEDVIIVSGLLRGADQAVQMHDFLDNLGYKYVDTTSIAGVQQVQIDVRVAEASRVAMKSLGVNLLYADKNFYGGTFPNTGSSLATGVTFENGTYEADFSSAVTVLAGIPRANLDAFIEAITENQYLRILANPTLVALSGNEASFLVGGEYPIPIAQGNTQSVTIEYKEYGVRVVFRPVVLGDGTIRLQVAPEVSELSSAGSVESGGYSIPALIVRKAETTLELNSGQTFAMAGLIQNKDEAIRSGLPGLSDLPVLGPLFSSIYYQRNETELVLLVTVSLVEPMSINASASPLPGDLYNEPNDWEFYIEGEIESNKPAKIDPVNGKILKQLGLDKLAGPGAWDSYIQKIAASHADLRTQSDRQKAEAQAIRSYYKKKELENLQGGNKEQQLQGTDAVNVGNNDLNSTEHFDIRNILRMRSW